MDASDVGQVRQFGDVAVVHHRAQGVAAQHVGVGPGDAGDQGLFQREVELPGAPAQGQALGGPKRQHVEILAKGDHDVHGLLVVLKQLADLLAADDGGVDVVADLERALVLLGLQGHARQLPQRLAHRPGIPEVVDVALPDRVLGQVRGVVYFGALAGDEHVGLRDPVPAQGGQGVVQAAAGDDAEQHGLAVGLEGRHERRERIHVADQAEVQFGEERLLAGDAPAPDGMGVDQRFGFLDQGPHDLQIFFHVRRP